MDGLGIKGWGQEITKIKTFFPKKNRGQKSIQTDQGKISNKKKYSSQASRGKISSSRIITQFPSHIRQK